MAEPDQPQPPRLTGADFERWLSEQRKGHGKHAPKAEGAGRPGGRVGRPHDDRPWSSRRL
jgi:hypothetical protein